MAKHYAPSLGSISHGTLLAEDLIEAFSDELALLAPDHDLPAEAEAIATLHSFGWADIYAREEAEDLVYRLMDALNESAPAYCYFGANEGDGSDFGFWPCLSAIEYLPKVSSPNEAAAMGEDCVFVNDHGNITVYAADGSVIWDCV